ncbi:hypothetical protein MASR2M74_27590 [Paracoccaceae bacterium]
MSARHDPLDDIPPVPLRDPPPDPAPGGDPPERPHPVWTTFLAEGEVPLRHCRKTAHELLPVRRNPQGRTLGIEPRATNVGFRPGEGGWRRWVSPRNQFYEPFDDGFYGIPDAENVYEIMRAIQKGQP